MRRRRLAARRELGRPGGFTLLELLIALSIVAALLAIAFGGMRVGLAAWRQGEDRAEAHQHVRGVSLTIARAVGAAYPYRASRGDAPQPELLFGGQREGVELVTQAAPFPFVLPIAFTAVVIALEEGEQAGLVIRQRALPNWHPFTEAAVVFHDPSVTTLELGYLDARGAWHDVWDPATRQDTLPSAVRIVVGIDAGGRTEMLPAITVPLRTGAP